MNETGTVIQIDKQRILVCTDNVSSKKDCQGGCAGCNTQRKSKSLWVARHPVIAVQLQDKVEIYYPPGKTIVAAFFILIFPLVLFFLFYFLAALFVHGEQEFIRALWGLLGIGCGFLINFIIQKISKNPPLPEIIRKIN